MKILVEKLLTCFILLLTLSIAARTNDSNKAVVVANVIEANSSIVLPSTNPNAFVKAAKKNNIPQREFNDLKGLKNGYYIIAGVFGESGNALKMLQKLRKKGFSANYIPVRRTGLNYVYLNYHKNWEDAIAACNTKFNGNYSDTVWIMNARGQGEKIIVTPSKETEATADYLAPKKANVSVAQRSFLEVALENNIATRKISPIEGVNSGYYIVSGVFGDEKNAKKAAYRLRKKGFKAHYLFNPGNNLNYTYLEHTTNWKNVIRLIQTKFDGSFKEKVWVLHIASLPETIGMITQHQGSKMESSEGLRKNTPSFEKVKDSKKKSKLQEKADSYFDKMWYAEAAQIYEQILERGTDNYSFEIIQKAGDSHYFNTNMEKAYHWYNILYERYGDEMSADNIFKYAHSLKGTGKYGRSKRLMRLYNRKIKAPNAASANNLRNKALPNEVVLDELRNSTNDFEIFNLAINSKYSEFSPMFHNNDQVVFASANDTSIFNTRRYKWNNQPYLDLYVAKLNEESQELRDAIKFSKKVNTKYHEASVAFSPDNKTMYFTRNNYGKKLKRDKKGVNHLKIYKSVKVNGSWTEASEVSFNSDDYSTGHPALSPDGKLLYFVSDMPGTIGQTDLFVVDVLDNGSFSEPRNLGPQINTERREMFPYISDEKLYFASNGHVGLGGLDVYEATLDAEEGFVEVKNMGQPINSNKDDFSYIVNEENQKGFFASNRRGGKGDDDIYSFKRLVVEEVPENLNAIAGIVTELITEAVMPRALITLLDENNIKLKEMVAGDDGSFLFEDLEGDTKYTLRATQNDYFDEELSVATKSNELVHTEVAMRRLKEMITIEDGIRKLKTEMIYFNFDKFNIRRDASEELDKLVQVMEEYPTMLIKIESHTDSRGPKAYNKYLSDKRAKSTRDYIISKGIDPNRIESAIGYGEEKLINNCDGTVRCSEANHLLNRRSEFIIVDM